MFLIEPSSWTKKRGFFMSKISEKVYPVMLDTIPEKLEIDLIRLTKLPFLSFSLISFSCMFLFHPTAQNNLGEFRMMSRIIS